MVTNRGDDGGKSYPQDIHKQGVSYPQVIHRLSTGYPQVKYMVIHRLSTGYPQQRPPFKRHLRALKEPCRRGGSHRDHGTEHNQERFLTVYTESKG